jgi:hypothetical protein
VAARAGALAASPGLAGTAPASPGTYLAAERALLSAVTGPHGLGPVAARLAALGVAARAAAAAYREAESAVTGAQRQAEHEVARAAGTLVGLVSQVAAGPVLGVGLGLVAAARNSPPAAGPPCVPAAPDSGVGLPGTLAWRLLGQRAGLIEHLVDATPSALTGLLHASDVQAPGVPALDRALLGTGSAAVLAVLGPPSDVPGTAAALSGLGRVSPLLHESGRVRARAVGAPRAARSPSGVAAVMVGLDEVSTASDECAPGLARSRPLARIRVQRLDRPDGGRSWIVAVPGTRTWSPVTGPNPLDLTGNVRAMAQQRTAAGSAVLAAMRQSGVRPGEPVLLAGHSQGGLVVADLAADPAVRREFTITHVVTAGSPVARDPIPADVEVLALEHDDLVPQLDGAPNPATPNWVTVTRAASADPAVQRIPSPMPNHSLAGYVRTAAAVDASDDPSLVVWRRTAAPFLPGPAAPSTEQDFDAERVQP